MGHDNPHQILAAAQFSRRGGGGGGACGRRTAPLNTRVHIGLVIIADIEDVLVSLHGSGQGLQADIHRAAVSCKGHNLCMCIPLVFESPCHTACNCCGVLQIPLDSRNLHAALDPAAGEHRRTAGGG